MGAYVAVGLDLFHYGQKRWLVIFYLALGNHHLGKIDRDDGDPRGLQQLFGIAHGLERAGTRANRPQPRPAQATHGAADPRKPL